MSLPAHSAWSDAQRASDRLWAMLRPDALYLRPIPERHRLIFYLGHLEAFDWNLLAPALGLQPFRPEWDKLFAFGIDPVEGALPSEPASAWPREPEVADYNRSIREKLAAALLAAPGAAALNQRLQVAIEHRWMHVETLSYLFHNLGYEHKVAGPPPPLGPGPEPAPAPAEIPAGPVLLGQVRSATFGWDNEFDQHEVAVPAFSASRYKVTNAEYLEFVAAGAAPPHFWRRRGQQWFYTGMFAEVPLPGGNPVWVTHAEAAAYCVWRGVRLPTEAEWQRMAYATPGGGQRSYPWGEAAPESAAGNFDGRAFDPMPTAAFPQSASAWGVQDLVGNGWEWTADPFAPFPGFQPFPFYPGYSANFFDGRHFVLKGGSGQTAACLLRSSFRNWFQPNYPYLYSGFRWVGA
ncbi:MAG: formylglycine-generating enzyme family protein [Terriglobales bacterium]